MPITVGSDSIKENDEVVTMLFWKKEQKVVVALSPREVRLMMTALLNFRNKAVLLFLRTYYFKIISAYSLR